MMLMTSRWVTGSASPISSVWGKRGQGLGGGLLNEGSCGITASTLQRGSADVGGGIYNHSEGVLALLASTLSNNIAGTGAGASNHGRMTISNVTFSDNGGTLANRGWLELKRSVLKIPPLW